MNEVDAGHPTRFSRIGSMATVAAMQSKQKKDSLVVEDALSSLLFFQNLPAQTCEKIRQNASIQEVMGDGGQLYKQGGDATGKGFHVILEGSVQLSYGPDACCTVEHERFRQPMSPLIVPSHSVRQLLEVPPMEFSTSDEPAGRSKSPARPSRSPLPVSRQASSETLAAGRYPSPERLQSVRQLSPL